MSWEPKQKSEKCHRSWFAGIFLLFIAVVVGGLLLSITCAEQFEQTQKRNRHARVITDTVVVNGDTVIVTDTVYVTDTVTQTDTVEDKDKGHGNNPGGNDPDNPGKGR
jgi:hypothetical protein